MQRMRLLGLLNGYRDREGSDNFTITVPLEEARSVNMSLIYLRAEGIIADFERLDPPYGCNFYIEGFGGI